MKEYEKIRHANRLSTTAIDLLHLIREFGKLHGIKDEVTIHLVDDQLQKLETDTYGIFQLYFYVNLLTSIEGSSIINGKTLSKFTLKKLLNEIFSLDRDSNEKKIEQFVEESEIKKGD